MSIPTMTPAAYAATGGDYAGPIEAGVAYVTWGGRVLEVTHVNRTLNVATYRDASGCSHTTPMERTPRSDVATLRAIIMTTADDERIAR